MAGALAGATLAGCGSHGDPSAAGHAGARHLLLITVDTLRADHMSLYGYPRATSPGIDRLAAGGTTFDQAVAQWPLTGASFASLFTGRYPDTTGLTHQARTPLPEGYVTLAERLSENGFTSVAVVSNAVLSREIGWAQGFAEYLETWGAVAEIPEDPIEYRRTSNAARVNQLALPLLDRHRAAERLFAWIHYSDPHAPYVLPDGVANPFLGDERYAAAGSSRIEPGRWHLIGIGDERERRFYEAQYDANVLFVDRQIEGLLRHAGELGLLEDTLVVLTADHGEALGEHDYWGHGAKPHNVGVQVPLVFVQPGAVAAGQRVTAPVELVDLYVTLETLLDLGENLPGLEGDDLTARLRSERRAPAPAAGHRPTAFSGAGGKEWDFRSVQDAEWRLTWRLPKQGGPAAYFLFRLSDDPLETRDLLGTEPAQARRLAGELGQWVRGRSRDRPPPRAGDDDEQARRALRALGYLD